MSTAPTAETPWSELSVGVSDVSKRDMLKRAGLDWRVTKNPLYVEHGGARVEVRDKFALVRESDGTPLTIVSHEWAPTQNEDALEVFTELAKSVGGVLRALGSLKKDRMIWALIETDMTFSAGGRETRGHLLVANPHVYGKAMDARYLAVTQPRLATIGFPIHAPLRASHRSVQVDVEALSRIADDARQRHAQLAQSAQVLSATKLEKPDAFFASVGTSARHAATLSKIHAELKGETLWDAVNSVAHAMDARVGHSADTRLFSSWYGRNHGRKHRALDEALKIARKDG